MTILRGLSTVLELVGFGFVAFAAFLVARVLGFCVLGVIIVFVGYSLDPAQRPTQQEVSDE